MAARQDSAERNKIIAVDDNQGRVADPYRFSFWERMPIIIAILVKIYRDKGSRQGSLAAYAACRMAWSVRLVGRKMSKLVMIFFIVSSNTFSGLTASTGAVR